MWHRRGGPLASGGDGAHQAVGGDGGGARAQPEQGGAGAWTRVPGGPEDRDHVDLAAYERLLDAVRVEQSATRTVPDRDDVTS